MAGAEGDRLGPAVVGSSNYAPPTSRQLRAHSVQRLQIGLFGLALMLLLVGLANIIKDRARMADAQAGVGAIVGSGAGSAAGHAAPGDPLADLGVVPAQESRRAAGGPRPRNGGNGGSGKAR